VPTKTAVPAENSLIPCAKADRFPAEQEIFIKTVQDLKVKANHTQGRQEMSLQNWAA